MSDITITANKVMDTSAALANLAQILDTVQKSTDSFSKSLKAAADSIGGAVTVVTNAVKGADNKPLDQLLAQLTVYWAAYSVFSTPMVTFLTRTVYSDSPEVG